MKTFDQWWAEYWKQNDMQPVFNQAMRDIAKAAWDAAQHSETSKVTWVREYRNKHGSTLYEALNEYYRTFP